jgi:tol-pal system protein YbgF
LRSAGSRFRVRVAPAGLALFLAAAGGGCVSMWEGDRIRADIKKLRDRVGDLERKDTETEQRLAQLRKLLDEATTLLARNSADVGARVQLQEAVLAQVQGKIDEATHVLEELKKKTAEEQARLANIEANQAKIASKVAPAMAEDKEQLWRQASDFMTQGNREEGRRFFRGFIQRFPQDPRAPQAYLQIGQSFAMEGRHTQAVAEYDKVLTVYSKSPEVPEAMWLLGQSFVDLKFCSDARAVLQDLSRRYPKSPRATEVKNRLREIIRISRDKKLCTN